jgi:hypothetical protein
MPADDTRKSDFFKNLLPELLRPRIFSLSLDFEAVAGFTEMEALSAQVTLADGETLDAIIKEAKGLLDELDSLEDYIMEDAQHIGGIFQTEWPYEVSLAIRLDSGKDNPPVVEG